MKSFVHFIKVHEENIVKQQIKSSLCINSVSTGVSHSSVSLRVEAFRAQQAFNIMDYIYHQTQTKGGRNGVITPWFSSPAPVLSHQWPYNELVCLFLHSSGLKGSVQAYRCPHSICSVSRITWVQQTLMRAKACQCLTSTVNVQRFFKYFTQYVERLLSV